MSGRTNGSEARAAEAALPGSVGIKQVADMEAKAKHLRKTKTAGKAGSAAPGANKLHASVMKSKAATRWQKAGRAVSVHGTLAASVRETHRGLVGMQIEGDAGKSTSDPSFACDYWA